MSRSWIAAIVSAFAVLYVGIFAALVNLADGERRDKVFSAVIVQLAEEVAQLKGKKDG